MSVFRNAVQDCLDYEPEDAKKALKSNQLKKPSDAEFEKFSGLLIRYVSVNPQLKNPAYNEALFC